jgi:hypothetical protein
MIVSEKHESRSGEAKDAARGDVSEYSDVYSKVKKSEVVQEAKCFHSKEVDERKCIELLAKIIYLANHVNKGGPSDREKSSPSLRPPTCSSASRSSSNPRTRSCVDSSICL